MLKLFFFYVKVVQLTITYSLGSIVFEKIVSRLVSTLSKSQSQISSYLRQRSGPAETVVSQPIAPVVLDEASLLLAGNEGTLETIL